MWKVFLSLCLVSLPAIVLAAGLVPCGGPGEEPCQTCHVVKLVLKVSEWLVIVLGVVAALMVVIAGFRLVLSVGDASAKASAKRTIAKMFVGYVIVLAAWLLIDLGLKTFLNDSTYGVWNAVQCVAQPSDILGGRESATGDNLSVLPAAEISSRVAGINASPLNAAIVEAAVAAGIYDPVQINVFRALISQESNNCTDKVGPETKFGVAYGCGQLLVSTAKSLDPNLSNMSDEAIALKLQNDDLYNLSLSAQYFSQLLNRYPGDTDLAVAVYNAGPAAGISSYMCFGLNEWECIWDSPGCYNTNQTSCVADEDFVVTRNLVANINAILADPSMLPPVIPPTNCAIKVFPDYLGMVVTDTKTLTMKCDAGSDIVFTWTKDGAPLEETSAVITVTDLSIGNHTYRATATNSAGTKISEVTLNVGLLSTGNTGYGSGSNSCVESDDPGLGTGSWVPPNTSGRMVADPGGAGMMSLLVPGCLNGQTANNSQIGCGSQEWYVGEPVTPFHFGEGKQLLLRFKTNSTISESIDKMLVSSHDGGAINTDLINMRIWLSTDPASNFENVPEGCRVEGGSMPAIGTTAQSSAFNAFPVCKLEPNTMYYFGMTFNATVTGEDARFKIDTSSYNTFLPFWEYSTELGFTNTCTASTGGTSWYEGDPGTGSWIPPGIPGVLVVDPSTWPQNMHIPACVNGHGFDSAASPCYQGAVGANYTSEDGFGTFEFAGGKTLSIRRKGIDAFGKIGNIQIKDKTGATYFESVTVSLSATPGDYQVSPNCFYEGPANKTKVFYANSKESADAYFAKSGQASITDFAFCKIDPNAYYYLNVKFPSALSNEQFYLITDDPLNNNYPQN